MRRDWKEIRGLVAWLFMVMAVGATLWAIAIYALISAMRWIVGGS